MKAKIEFDSSEARDQFLFDVERHLVYVIAMEAHGEDERLAGRPCRSLSKFKILLFDRSLLGN